MSPEIRSFEFALGLFSVLIGLAIADVAASFHRLMRVQARVRWDPLAVLAALFAVVLIVGMWFDLWGIRNATSVRHFFAYLLLTGTFFLLFLIAASSLPDEAHRLPRAAIAIIVARWTVLIAVPAVLVLTRSRVPYQTRHQKKGGGEG